MAGQIAYFNLSDTRNGHQPELGEGNQALEPADSNRGSPEPGDTPAEEESRKPRPLAAHDTKTGTRSRAREQAPGSDWVSKLSSENLRADLADEWKPWIRAIRKVAGKRSWGEKCSVLGSELAGLTKASRVSIYVGAPGLGGRSHALVGEPLTPSDLPEDIGSVTREDDLFCGRLSIGPPIWLVLDGPLAGEPEKVWPTVASELAEALGEPPPELTAAVSSSKYRFYKAGNLWHMSPHCARLVSDSRFGFIYRLERASPELPLPLCEACSENASS